MASIYSITAGKKTYKDSATSADTYVVGADAKSLTLAGKVNGDTIAVEGLASEYKIKASGRTITMTSDDGQKIVFQLAVNGSATIKFLDGGLTATYTGKAATLGTQKLSTKAAVVNDSALDDTKSSADTFDSAGSGSSGGSSGSTFVLTTGVDGINGGTNFTGSSGNDVFTAVAGTWNAFDEVDGGSGTDVMNIATTDTTASATTKIVNVETLNLNTTGAGYTIDTTDYTGLTALNLSAANTGAVDVVVTAATTTTTTISAATIAGDVTLTGGKNVNVTANAADDVLIIGAVGTATVKAGSEAGDILSVDAQGLTSVTVTDGGIVAIGDGLTALADVTFNDDATTDTLTTVSIAGNAGVATINSDVLTSLSLADSDQNATVTAAAGTRTLGLTVNKLTGGTIADSTATTLNVTSTGSATTGVTIQAGAATSVNIVANAALTAAALTAGVATAVNISGSAATTITADTLDANAVITSTNTGGVTITQALLAGQKFAGSASSGADSISIATTSTVAHSTGAGDDTVIIDGAFGTDGSVDAGSGTDTVSLTEALAANDSLSADTTFAGQISGFEKLALTTVTGSKTINLSNLDNISYVTTTAATALTLDNIASSGTVELTAATNDVTVNVKDASLGGHGSDVLNIKLFAATSGTNVDYGTLTAAAVEAINILSTRSGTVEAADSNEINLTVANALTINVTGDVLADLDGAALTGAALTTINARTNTGGMKVSVVGATQGIAITGSATAASTIVGGSGGDVITGGTGADSLSGGAGADVITAGAGADTVTGGTGADTIDLGNDTAQDVVVTTIGGAYTTAAADTISNFKAGVGGDILQIDISDSTAIANLGIVTAGDGATAITGNLVIKTMTKGTGVTLAATDEILVITGTYANSAALLADIGTGAGTVSWFADPTDTNGLLVVWSDGTNTHVSAVSDADAANAAAMVTADLALTDIAVLSGVLTAFNTINFTAVA